MKNEIIKCPASLYAPKTNIPPENYCYLFKNEAFMEHKTYLFEGDARIIPYIKANDYRFLPFSQQNWESVIRSALTTHHAFIAYGSAVEKDSYDIDGVYLPTRIVSKLPKMWEASSMFEFMEKGGQHLLWFRKNEKQKNFVDLIGPEFSSFTFTFAYLNLKADYGSFADEWLVAAEEECGVQLIDVEEFLLQNERMRLNVFEETLLPRAWVKWQFAKIQAEAYREGAGFLNRKSQILKYVTERGNNDLAEALYAVWYGDYLNGAWQKVAGVEVEINRNEQYIIFQKDDQIQEYPINIDIHVYSASKTDMEEIMESLWSGPPDDKSFIPSSLKTDIKVNFEHCYWDGYGI